MNRGMLSGLGMLAVVALGWMLLAQPAREGRVGPEAAAPDTRHADTALQHASAPQAPTLRPRAPRAAKPDPVDKVQPTRTLQIVNRRGEPVAKAGVAWWLEPHPAVYRGYRARQSDRRTKRTTDASGVVALPHDVPRGYHVGVQHWAHVWFEAPLRLESGVMRIVLEPDVDVSGRLTDDRGRAIVGAWIHAYDARPHAEQRASWTHADYRHVPPGMEPAFDGLLATRKTDHSGLWSMRLREGRARLVVHLASGTTVERTMHVEEGGEHNWRLRLPPGRVMHTTIEPPPGAEHLDFDVQLFTGHANGRLDIADGFQVNDPTSPDGRIASLDLPPAGTPYFIVVFHAHDDIPCHVVGPLRGARTDLRVRLPDDAHHHGSLRGGLPAGSYMADLSAIITDARGFETEVTLEEDETFEARGLPLGRYAVRIQTQDDRVIWHRPGIDVDADATTRIQDIRFALPQDGDD